MASMRLQQVQFGYRKLLYRELEQLYAVGTGLDYLLEHIKNKRKSTWNKHTKPRTDRANERIRKNGKEILIIEKSKEYLYESNSTFYLNFTTFN